MAENQKKNNGMLTRRRLSGWLRAPQFDSPEITRKGRLLHLLLLVLIGLTLFTYIGATMSPDPAQAYIVVTLTLGVLVLCYILMRKGRVRLAAGIMVIVLWVSVVGTVMVSGGIGNTPYISLILVATIATLLLGGPAGLLFAGISAAAGAVFLILELGGLLLSHLSSMIPSVSGSL